jgi:hypothetical protein
MFIYLAVASQRTLYPCHNILIVHFWSIKEGFAYENNTVAIWPCVGKVSVSYFDMDTDDCAQKFYIVFLIAPNECWNGMPKY